MYRPIPPLPPVHSRGRLQAACVVLLFPLTVWILVTLMYGYYGDRLVVLGPSSSMLLKASSVFVKLVEVRDKEKTGVILYGYSEKPELVCETNWSVSKYTVVSSYSREGYPLWLNKGSRIRMRWETQTSLLNQIQVVMIKGKYDSLLPKATSSHDALNLSAPINGKDVEYTIEEDDKYYLALVNTNSKSVVLSISINVTSKMYDPSKARSMCSMMKGSCRLSLQFPKIHYVLVTTPDNGDTDGWSIELDFVARIITYIAILGFVTLIIYLILKTLGACDGESSNIVATASPQINSETEPMLPTKLIPVSYGTNEQDDDDDAVSSSSSSSENLYDAKLCVICYDEQRNCFFVPCGHCATCYVCTQRIMEEDNKMCPICRRLIHKVKRLSTP